MARPKATVCPSPVWAETMRSRPSASGSSTAAWTVWARHSRGRRALRREAGSDVKGIGVPMRGRPPICNPWAKKKGGPTRDR
jgi:hypothetical protein